MDAMPRRQEYQLTQQTTRGGGSLLLGLLVAALVAGIAATLLFLPPLNQTLLARYFAATAGIVLLAMLYRFAQILAYRRRVARLERQHPHAPWWRDYPWDPSGIDAPLGRRLRYWLVRLLASGAILAPIHHLFLRDVGVIAFIGFWPVDLFYLWMVQHTAKQYLAYRKYGRLRVGFARFPFAPGGVVKLALTAPHLVACRATLRFIREEYWNPPHPRRGPRPVAYEHYAERLDIAPPEATNRYLLEFTLPDNPDWVTRLTAAPNVQYWELQLESQQPGVDLDVTYPLPVYAGAYGAPGGVVPET